LQPIRKILQNILRHNMHILLDANISWRLVDKLKPYFDKVEHVESIELNQPAKDLDIWEYAKQHTATIITNDDDFSILSVSRGYPPKVVLLKTGNQSNKYLFEIIVKHVDDIEKLFISDDIGLIEII
jgi:predicted nuclease of predicted toxin-antitoxin system